MKKNFLFSGILLAALSITSVSCNKPEKEKSRTDLILGTWIVSGSGVDANGNNILEPAERDSNLQGYILKQTFNASGSGELEVVVSNQSFSKTPFSWNLTENDQTLRIIQNDTNEVAITLLTETQFEYYDKGSSPHRLTTMTR